MSQESYLIKMEKQYQKKREYCPDGTRHKFNKIAGDTAYFYECEKCGWQEDYP